VKIDENDENGENDENDDNGEPWPWHKLLWVIGVVILLLLLIWIF